MSDHSFQYNSLAFSIIGVALRLINALLVTENKPSLGT